MAAKFKVPARVSTAADMLYEIRQERYDMQKKVAELESKESMLKDFIINNLEAGEATGISGKVARVTVVAKDKVKVDNWDDFFDYVRKKKAFHLLQKRVNENGVKEIINDKKNIPGVSEMIIKTVSVNKVK